MSETNGVPQSNPVPKSKPVDAVAIQALITAMTSERDGLKRQKARLELVDIGSPAVPYLVEAMQNKREWARWEVANALGEIADAAAVPVLVEALRDKVFDVRWLAAKGLIRIGWRSIIPVIESLIDHADAIWMRDGAHHVLHDLARGRFQEPLGPILTSLKGIEAAVEIPLVGRKVLEALKPIEVQAIREEQEAREKAEPETENGTH
ncbi:MAG: HEAT repeat domain-containing protein [Dehalococcoidia bacterium]|nr:HEAT repeat domain-containing protein [Dehalococcoidia bacterium]